MDNKLNFMDTLNCILKKYNLKTGKNPLIEIPNVGRDDLAKLFHELNFKLGAEVGVAAGEYSRVICENNPQLTKMCGVDPWKYYKEYKDYVREKTFTNLKIGAFGRLAKFTFYEFIEEFSMDALKRFEDNSLDFVYIDANHLDPYVTNDIFSWANKVRSGGIISGHDWQSPRKQNYKVKEAVTRYVVDHKINPFFVFGSKERRSGFIRDNSRSWVIIK